MRDHFRMHSMGVNPVATFAQLIAAKEAELKQCRAVREQAIAEIKTILSTANRDARNNLSEDETARVNELFATRDRKAEDISKHEGELGRLQAAQLEEAEVASQMADSTRQPAAKRPAYDHLARVGFEQRTYRPDQDPKGIGFVRDVLSFFRGDPGAGQRLGRHQEEEAVERSRYLSPNGPYGQQRAVGTGAFAGLVVPQYLTELYAPGTANLRPLADVANHHPLPPDGMTVNISRITTGSSVALQTSENSAVAEVNMDDTILTENVQTAAGQQTISRQAVDRGTGIDEVVLQDLFNRYASALDSTLINQATFGLSANAATVTYTDAAPTVAALWPFLFKAASLGEQAFLAMAAVDHVVMHTRRWNWMQSQVGTSWPFMGIGGLPEQQGAQIIPNIYGTGAVRGILSNGAKVVVDNNVPLVTGGNEDEIYVVAPSEIHLWEDPNAPLFIRADGVQAANLGVLLVVYGYFAFFRAPLWRDRASEDLRDRHGCAGWILGGRDVEGSWTTRPGLS
jgi:hypothetical protein